MKKVYQKIIKKLTWFFCFHLIPFYGQDYDKKRSGLVTILFLGCKSCSENLLFSDVSHGQFNDLTKIGFRVIPKVTFAKSIHNSIITPFSSDYLNLETITKNGRKYYKKWISQEWKELFRWNKK